MGVIRAAVFIFLLKSASAFRCGDNAHFNVSATACPLTCVNKDNPPVCTLSSIPRCQCNQGYVLDSQGNCIQICDCPPPVCDQNARFNKYASACPITCENKNDRVICNKAPVARCECVPGFILDHKGRCIRECDCPSCGPHSRFRHQASGCPITCETFKNPRPCNQGPVARCVCDAGYVLNHEGICILEANCPSCGPNARFNPTASGCPLSCENKDIQFICNQPSAPRCECKPGFVLDRNGNCIQECDCPKCPPFSHFNYSASACPYTCENKDTPFYCTKGFRARCQCEAGYVLDINGNCIASQLCPKCGPNSQFKFCGTACPKTCENKDLNLACAAKCVPRCVCNPGFVLNHLGDCIKECDCPSCPVNSRFEVKASACPVTCENKDFPTPCSLGHKPRCVCIPGFVLNINGECIPENQCPKCPPNAHFRFNATSCLLTCENVDFPQYCNLGFRPRCVCRPGYVLDHNRNCVLIGNCPRCPPNSRFRFNTTACLVTCENMDEPRRCNLGFKPRCECSPGYVLDPNNNCILSANCPKCAPNSRFRFNATACVRTCENKDSMGICQLGFKPRCICNPGFVRDERGNCIPEGNCPRCAPNSRYRFNATSCIRTCENFNDMGICQLGFKARCICNPGFVRDQHSNCISEGNCPRCPPNAHFRFNATACLATCENVDGPQYCSLGFRPRCICKRGFVLDQNGNCILATNCPRCPPNSRFRFNATACIRTCEYREPVGMCRLGYKPSCECAPGYVLDQNRNCILETNCPRCPPNAHFRFNATACLTTCENIDGPKACNLGFRARCICRPGFVLDQSGNCIPETNCPKCPPYSRFRFNATACVLTCENKDAPPRCLLGFKPRCQCLPGYVLDHVGNCVLATSCPKCPPHSDFRFNATACPSTCENLNAPVMCRLGFRPRCVCRPGHTLDHKGNCIKEIDCPKCGPNSLFRFNATACVRTCENKDIVQVCNLGFTARCICNPGFVLDHKGNCIPEGSCPVCGPNARFASCGSACPKTCANRNTPIVCTKQCVARCACLDGFVLDHEGNCIPERNCPSCPDNAIFDPRATICIRTCHNMNTLKECTLGVKARCRCKDGFVLDHNGICIPEANCPKCGPNQVFNPHASSCRRTCVNFRNIRECEMGYNARCECIPGFVWDHEGNCIPERNCPSCPDNAFFDPLATVCIRTCANMNTLKECTLGVKARCRCNNGFVLDHNGICIPEANCPRCAPNQAFNPHASACLRTCANMNEVKECILGFKARCECIRGFVLDHEGNCIPETNCPSCPANSFFDPRAPACVLTCDNMNNLAECTLGIKPRCRCINGFVLDHNGVCIPETSCPRCGPNQIFNPRAPACIRTCENMKNLRECTLGHKARCECIRGFVLDHDGNCIPERNCPSCPDPNSFFDPHAPACLRNCENMNIRAECTLGFKARCRCKKGFVLDYNGGCILEANCPRCGPNQLFNPRASACIRTCENANNYRECTLGYKARCECIGGFVLDHDGNCIPERNCPKCPPNSHFKAHASACLRTCANMNVLTDCTLGFKARCICNKGFVLDHNGICVSEGSCPSCGPNQFFNPLASACFRTCENMNVLRECFLGLKPRCECIRGFVLDHDRNCIPERNCPSCPRHSHFEPRASACLRTCENKNIIRECALGHKARCVCNKGFIFDHNGVCILEGNCPRCGPNQIFNPRASACLRSCENRNIIKECKLGHKPRCQCIAGYILDHDGNCIPESNCPSCPANSHYKPHASACLRTCANMNVLVDCTLGYKARCVCNKGFVLDHHGVCIPEVNCPRCGPNQLFNPRASACVRTCENWNVVRECALGLKARCECIRGFVLDHDGNCIPERNCPSCPAFSHFKPHASACLRTCQNMNNLVDCTLGYKARCVCNKGYVLDHNGACIPEANCPRCGPNQIFNPLASACPRTCQNLNVIRECALGFKPRCECIRGHVLDHDGNCIPERNCPSCPENSHFSPHALACLRTCENMNILSECTLGHKARCVCNKGFVLDHNGICIREGNCPRCGPNEMFNPRAPACLRSCANKNAYKDCTLGLKPRCECIPGFIRNHEGACIPETNCPSCQANAHFHPRAPACIRTCENMNVLTECTLGFKARCMCNKGFVLDHTGVCIPEGNCPRCGPNEMFNPRAPACVRSCANKNACKECKLGFKARCQCIPGFILNHEGVCIPEENCPSCEANAYFEPRAPACIRTCENMDALKECTLGFKARCMCNKGYVLDHLGVCIPEGNCPRCGPNERFNPRASACLRSCANKNACKECKLGSKARCECIPGFILNHEGVCIPEQNCPSCPANSYFEPRAPGCIRTCENMNALKECTLGFKARCMCNKGYVLDHTGVCIPEANCPRCGPNEVFNPRASACLRTCENKHAIKECALGIKARCECIPGFILNHEGVCIPERNCPSCGPNSVFNPRASACVITCENMNSVGECQLGHKARCECVKGFVLDNKGNCIRRCDCPICDVNEHFNVTATGCPRTCENKNYPQPCNLPSSPKCQCNPGFVLDHRRVCIPESECPKCGPNSHFNPAASACPRTCENRNKNKRCRLGIVARCQCDKGFYLDPNGNCVKECDCPVIRKCPPHSHYNETASACPITCKNMENPPLCNLPCKPKCECDHGYVLSMDGICIKRSACKPKCGRNEHFNWCAPPVPRTCQNRKSPKPSSERCSSRCECDAGYVLNKDHTCIKECECDDCGPNAHFTKCVSNCPRTCSNLNDVLMCSKECRRDGCECDDGFVFDNYGNCVLERDCPDPRCGRNAFYSHHLPNSPVTCSNRHQRRDVQYNYCKKGGCRCKSGYVLDNLSNCILVTECPN